MPIAVKDEDFARAAGIVMGHAESIRYMVAQAIAAERERCAQIAENPGFIQARDTEWDIGVNYAKQYIAMAIRRGVLG